MCDIRKLECLGNVEIANLKEFKEMNLHIFMCILHCFMCIGCFWMN